MIQSRGRVSNRASILLPVLIGIALCSWGARCGNPTPVEPVPFPGPDPTPSWQDEFEGPGGQSPDPAKWGYDLGDGCPSLCGWGNAQLEYDTDRPVNVSLDGEGHLAITARQESFGGRQYTSARIKTQGLFSQARGRFEARIKLPVGQGIWPAFWLLGSNITTVGWPACGEIDIMEYRGQEPGRVLGSLHGPGYSGGNSVTGNVFLPLGQDFNDNFHVFGIEWERNRIVWTLDGVPYHTVTPADLPSGARWVFDNPFFIILNVAVGGNFVGSPDQSTSFPQTMLIDWVRVYSSAS